VLDTSRSTQASAPPPPSLAPGSPQTPGRVAAIVGAGLFLTVAVGTGVNTALPALERQFEVPIERLQWVHLGFLASATLALPWAGALGDRRDPAPLFVSGAAVFAVGSLVCALAPSFAVLVAGRTLQGLGTAFVQGLALALVVGAAAESAAGAALGRANRAAAAAIVAGPALAGLLLSELSWRWLFGLTVPAAFALALWAAHDLPRRCGTHAQKGAGGGAPAALGRSPALWLALTVEVAAFGVAHGFFFLFPLLLAGALKLSPLGIGVVLASNPALQALLTPAAGRWADRHGPQGPLLVGLAALAAGLLAMRHLDAETSPATVVLLLAPFGLAFACLTPAIGLVLARGVAPRQHGSAGALLALGRRFAQLGGVTLAAAAWAAPGPLAFEGVEAVRRFAHLQAWMASVVAVAACLTLPFLLAAPRGAR
jgi:MFS family permease